MLLFKILFATSLAAAQVCLVCLVCVCPMPAVCQTLPAGSVHPALSDPPQRTKTSRGHEGDPVNIAFIGSETDLHRTLCLAGWFAADATTLKTSLKIVAAVVVRKPYDHAPVSDLYLWDRKQDAAFEQPVGKSPKQRHHVRFWRSAAVNAEGHPLWLGAATYDERVELSRTTGVTHRIAPDVDKERDKIIHDAHGSGSLGNAYFIEPFHRAMQGKNGGGDPYYTDGRLAVGIISVRK